MTHQEYIQQIIEEINKGQINNVSKQHLWCHKPFNRMELSDSHLEHIYKNHHKLFKILTSIILGVFLMGFLLAGEFSIFFCFLLMITLTYLVGKYVVFIHKPWIKIDQESFCFYEDKRLIIKRSWKFCVYAYFKTYHGGRRSYTVLVLVDVKLREKEISIRECINIDNSLRDLGKTVFMSMNKHYPFFDEFIE